MLKRILLISAALVFLLSAYSQIIYNAEQIEKIMWNENFNPNFGIDTVKDEWKDYSAVVLAKEVRHHYRKPLLVSQFTNNRFLRLRVKVQNEKGVEEYGTMSFDMSFGSHKMFYGIKIIKPDQSEYIVDIDAIGKITEVTTKNSYRKQMKVAIPNLAPGDIVDYYDVRISDQFVQYYLSLNPEIYLFNYNYPVAYQKVSFDIQRKAYINMKLMNDAPDLLKSELDDSDLYYIEDRDREPYEKEAFTFPFRQQPYIKLQVTYAMSKNIANTIDFLGSPSIPKSDLTEDELYAYLKKVVNFGSTKHYGKLKRYFKKDFAGDLTDEDTVFKTAYYKIRNIKHVEKTQVHLTGGSVYHFYIQYSTYQLLAKFLADNNIDHYYYLTVPRSFTTLDDVILAQEIEIGLCVKTTDNTYYITDFGLYDNPDVTDMSIRGSEVLLWRKYPDYSVKTNRETIPHTQLEEDGQVTNFQIIFDALSLSNPLKIETKKIISGAHKPELKKYLLDYYDVKQEEFSAFKIVTNEASVNSDLVRNYMQDRPKNRHERLKSLVESEVWIIRF